jgi:hypothetical protein
VSDDPAFYERALRRMIRIAVVLALVATVLAAVRLGWRDGLGFGVGALVSVLNLHWWKRLVWRMGDTEQPARPASAVFLGMRYVILGSICFVIIKFFGVSYLALIAGLLVAFAAVLAEMVYELVLTR